MALLKMTFSLDDRTARRLALAAERLRKPKSAIVREAICDYSERIGRLSESERLDLLRRFDEWVPRIPERPTEEVDDELHGLRRSRRETGRRTPSAGP